MTVRERGALPKTTVLVVDDDLAVRELAAKIVAALGLEVLTAADGEAALALVREHGPAIGCVVLDLSMPGLGGKETLLELWRMHPELPVIVSSGHNEAEALESLPGQGRIDYLQKPFSAAALEARVRAALER